MITAQAYSDDRNVEVIFDCFEFFENASNEEIIQLARCGWGGDIPSDQVAISMADKVPDLAKMFTYLEIIAKDPLKKNCNGFECHVDEPQAKKWVQEYRPDLFKIIEANENVVPAPIWVLLDKHSGLLDNFVHSAKSAEAYGINNEGPESQVAYLLSVGFSVDEITKDVTVGAEGLV